MKWWRKAAAAGNRAATGMIGYLYENGHGVPQSYSKALHWLRKVEARGGPPVWLAMVKKEIAKIKRAEAGGQ